jgi:hypothetical protein
MDHGKKVVSLENETLEKVNSSKLGEATVSSERNSPR